MQKSFFYGNTYNAIKGVAVILLYILHFFASSDMWLSDYCLYSCLFFEKYFRYSANLCVAIFAFLTGYGFWFSSVKTFKRSFVKLVKVLRVYWTIYFLLLFLSVVSGIYSSFTLKTIVFELFGFDDGLLAIKLNPFCWYISFYASLMFIFPLSYIFLKRYSNIFRDIIYLLLMPLLIFSFFGNLFSSFLALKRFFVDLMVWFPCAGLGFISARYSLFDYLDQVFYFLCKNKQKYAEWFVVLIMMIITILGMYYCPGIIYYVRASLFLPFVLNMSVFYILFFIYAVTKLITLANCDYVTLVLTEIGKKSLYMWLLNAIFFNVFKEYTQPILFYPQYPLLILIWGLIICYGLAKGLHFFIYVRNK